MCCSLNLFISDASSSSTNIVSPSSSSHTSGYASPAVQVLNTPCDSSKSAGTTASTPTSSRDPNWPDTMPIPWSKMPKQLKDRRQFVTILTEEMMQFHPNPCFKQVLIVVKRLVHQYPDSFEDRTDANEKMGTGCMSLATQIKNKIDNLTRGDSIVRLRQQKTRRILTENNTESESAAQSVSKKTITKDSYGCVNWNPKNLPVGETKESLELAQKQLLEQHQLGPDRWDVNTIDELMNKTYCLQRYAINEKSPISILLDSWPLLFRPRWFLKHFETLVGCCVNDLMEKAKGKSGRLFRYYDESGKGNTNTQRTIREIRAECDQVQPDDLKCCFLLLLSSFGEESSSLIVQVDVSFISLFYTPKLYSSLQGQYIGLCSYVSYDFAAGKVKM
jgi:hypothetical protein